MAGLIQSIRKWQDKRNRESFIRSAVRLGFDGSTVRGHISRIEDGYDSHSLAGPKGAYYALAFDEPTGYVIGLVRKGRREKNYKWQLQ